MESVLGVDACAGGWCAVQLTEDQTPVVERFETFDQLWDKYRDTTRILVDIPIGLPETGTRAADQETRDRLGCRGSSVFDTICRPLLEVDDYDLANQRYRELAGKGLSKQAWNLKPKIQQVDTVKEREDRAVTVLRESHPELCFYALNEKNPIAYSKRSERGREKRLTVLESELDDARSVYDQALEKFLRKHVARDDIVDAMALAVAARDGSLTAVPDEPVETDPWFRIYYPDR